jgi:hypothetical protein
MVLGTVASGLLVRSPRGSVVPASDHVRLAVGTDFDVEDSLSSVSSVVATIADGMTTAEITADHPDLEPEDIVECLRYAAVAVQKGALPHRPYG